MLKIFICTCLFISSTCLFISSASDAAGLSFIYNSVAGNGTAMAGGGSHRDASLIFMNPAIAGYFLDYSTIGIVTQHLKSDVVFTNLDSKVPQFPPVWPAWPLSTVSHQQAVVPILFTTWPVRDSWVAGLSIAPTMISGADYKKWSGEFFAKSSQIINWRIMPVLAFSPQPSILLGGGIAYNSLSAMVKRNVNVSASLAHQLLEADNFLTVDNICSGALSTDLYADFSPIICDSLVYLDSQVYAQGNAISFVVGGLWQLYEKLKIGIAVSTEVPISLSGELFFSSMNDSRAEYIRELTEPTGPTSLQDRTVSMTLTVPQDVVISATYQAAVNWIFFTDLHYQGWESLQSLDIYDGKGLVVSNDFDWVNALVISIGVSYQWKPSFLLRGGVKQETSVASRNTPPALHSFDNTRYSTSIGFRYTLNSYTEIDGSILYLQRLPTLIMGVQNNALGYPYGPYLRGRMNVAMMMLGLQITRKF